MFLSRSAHGEADRQAACSGRGEQERGRDEQRGVACDSSSVDPDERARRGSPSRRASCGGRGARGCRRAARRRASSWSSLSSFGARPRRGGVGAGFARGAAGRCTTARRRRRRRGRRRRGRRPGDRRRCGRARSWRGSCRLRASAADPASAWSGVDVRVPSGATSAFGAVVVDDVAGAGAVALSSRRRGRSAGRPAPAEGAPPAASAAPGHVSAARTSADGEGRRPVPLPQRRRPSGHRPLLPSSLQGTPRCSSGQSRRSAGGRRRPGDHPTACSLRYRFFFCIPPCSASVIAPPR